MFILGINSAMHDSAASLLEDGRVAAFAEEERFSRVKHTGAFPGNAIQYCLHEAGIGINDIEHIAFFWSPWRGLARRAAQTLMGLPQSLSQNRERYRMFREMIALPGFLRREWGYRNAVHYVPHHAAHVCSAYYPSTFERAALLSIDANGEIATTRFAEGTGGLIRHLRDVLYPNSLGLLYLCTTEYLGFRENCDEGKVMGLAGHGLPKYLDTFREICRLRKNGGLRLDMSYFDVHLAKKDYVTAKFIAALGPRRAPEGPLDQRHADIAASLQARTEEGAIHMVKYLTAATGQTALCLAGGVALNSVMNGRLLREGHCREIFVQPAANDAGCALGAALYVHHVTLKRPERHAMSDTYLGPRYSEEECRRALDAGGIRYERPDNIARRCAQELAAGRILGWFQGRMEAGPRALGNRSILADPRGPDMKDILNQRVKHREGFRPFAPSVLAERCGEWFDCSVPSPYMLLVYNVLPAKRAAIPAVTHADGTARVQTLTRAQNPLYYELIREFEGLTGVPMVLNTSFNVRGEPIVCAPRDAVNCFSKTEMDLLALGPYLAHSPRRGDGRIP